MTTAQIEGQYVLNWRFLREFAKQLIARPDAKFSAGTCAVTAVDNLTFPNLDRQTLAVAGDVFLELLKMVSYQQRKDVCSRMGFQSLLFAVFRI